MCAGIVEAGMATTGNTNADNIVKLLDMETPFDFIEFIDKDGINHTGEGESFDASNREYYKEGIEGKTGIWINYYPKYSEEALLNFYTPLYSNGDVVGVITGTLGTDTKLLPMLETNFFGEPMIGILLDEKGQIIAISDKEIDREAYVDYILHDYGIDNEGIRTFNSHLRERDKGAFTIKQKRGKAIACIFTDPATDMKVIQIVPKNSINRVMRGNIIRAVCVMVAIFAIGAFVINYMKNDYGNRHREIIKENKAVVSNYNQILTATASDTIKGIRRIDVETGKADYLYFENHSIGHKEIGDWMEWVEKQRQFVHRHDVDKLIAFISIDNLLTMKEKTTYRISYRSQKKNKAGYYRTYTTVASIIYVEGRKTAILTTIDNTSAVINEMEQKRLLISAASIYISMHSIDLKNDILEELNSEDHIREVIGENKRNVQKVINDTMRKFTDEQYIDGMMDFINFATLDERMEGVNTITYEFYGRVSGWCRARFIAVDYDQNHKLTCVLWVVENIDAEKRKANRLLYLSETDLMTGIRNRGSGELKIKEYIAGEAKGLFFLMDVDKFKSINDNFGHKVGDKVLIAIATCLKESFRDSDVVMRLGGDEFAAFAVGIDTKEQAEPIINRLFRHIEAIDIPELGDRKITISLGVAGTRKKLDFDNLYKNADSCTYESKKTKGNSYTFYE